MRICVIYTGKAVSRAVRAHLLMDASLHGMLIRKALGIASADPGNPSLAQTFEPADQVTVASHDETIHPALKDIQKLYDDLLAKKSPEQASVW